MNLTPIGIGFPDRRVHASTLLSSFWFDDPQLFWWWCGWQHAEFAQRIDHGALDPRFGSHVVDVAPQQQRRDIDLRLRAAQPIGALPM